MLDIRHILAAANVPEHSIPFMQAVSGGAPFVQDGYVCFAKEQWLTIIGYPLQGAEPYSHEGFLKAKNAAVHKAGATDCFAIAPDLPEELQQHIQEKDVFYTLPATAPVPSKLVRPVQKATEKLHIALGTTFTAEHRRLWTEFLGRAALPNTPPMSAMVQKLFLTTPTVIGQTDTQLRLLDAFDADGRLTATLLLDFAPTHFCSYLLGAHSRTFYTPHAADALFAAMLDAARKDSKDYVHLGLGVNDGIRRFKRKWGAVPAQNFVLASWQENPDRTLTSDVPDLMRTLFAPKVASTQHTAQEKAALMEIMGKSKRQILASMPEQRPYAMLWQVQKGDKISWIGGAAHFFCYSFEYAFRELFDKADTVLFEGPLDAQSLKEVEAEGVRLTPEQQPLLPLLTEAEILSLERMVRGPEGRLARLLNMEAKRLVDVRWYLANARPWTSLFTLWTGFLERHGWSQSVDLEAWHLAHDMGKKVVAMESLEEQLASLNSVPPERVVRYFQNCTLWPQMIRKNIKAYLEGDLLRLTGTSAEFPTRTRTIISDRDERFRQRMRPFLEQGRAVVFVGTAHMLNLRHMLREDGFTLTQVTPTLKHKLRALFRTTKDEG